MLLLRAGLVSFGQALYYCLGAYAAGALGRFLGIGDIFLQMLAGAAASGLAALILGFLLAKYRGIFFGLLSLALSMILYGLLVKTCPRLDRRLQHPAFASVGILPGPARALCRSCVRRDRCPGAALACTDTCKRRLSLAPASRTTRSRGQGASGGHAVQ